jgi:phospholipase/lecithinase/hemolysin
LASQLGNLDGTFPAANIYRFDTFALLNDVVQNPVGYGFTNVTDACISSIDCANPDSQFLYWDSAHPTTEAHAILGAAFASAVPEPSATMMFIAGLFVLAWIARARKKPVYAGWRW